MNAQADTLIARLRGVHAGQPLDLACRLSDLCDEAANALAQRDAEIERLRAAIIEAAESIQSWGGYASDHFQQKHDLAGCVFRCLESAQPSAAQASQP